MLICFLHVHRFLLAGLLLVLFIFIGGAAVAQQAQFGQISSNVVDPSEAVVSGAKVTVTKVDTFTEEITQTNPEGLWKQKFQNGTSFIFFASCLCPITSCPAAGHDSSYVT